MNTSQNDLADRMSTRVGKSIGAPLLCRQMMSVFKMSMNIKLFIYVLNMGLILLRIFQVLLKILELYYCKLVKLWFRLFAAFYNICVLYWERD